MIHHKQILSFLMMNSSRSTSTRINNSSVRSFANSKFCLNLYRSSTSYFPQKSLHSSTGDHSHHNHNHNHQGIFNTDKSNNDRPQSRFLDEVETTIQNVFQKHNIQIPHSPSSSINSNSINFPNNMGRIDTIDTIIETIQPSSQRESVGVAINLYNRIHSLMKNGDCRRCWFQAAHCICDSIPSLEENEKTERKVDESNNQNEVIPTGAIPNVHRLFLLTHHKEIGLAVDTAKLILACFENTCRLVIGGIDGEFQSSMVELLDAVEQKKRRCMVLYPSEDAMTYSDLKRFVQQTQQNSESKQNKGGDDDDDDDNPVYVDDKWDIIVIDGTWSQARKFHTRYIPPPEDNGPFQVCLSLEAVRILDGKNVDDGTDEVVSGRQLRRHPIKWREISTLEATRLLIRDIMNEEIMFDDSEKYDSMREEPCYDVLAKYQHISDEAAKKQLGPPRIKRGL